MKTNTNKLNAAIRKLGLALKACAELGLTLRQVPKHQIKTGDYVVYQGKLEKVVATDPTEGGRVALESQGIILSLPGDEQLVLRGN